MLRSRITALAALFLSMTAASSAAANGRFPRAQRLVEDPRDPNRLLLGATYGLVYGAETDPMVDIAGDRSILATVFRSLNRSDPSGCNFLPRLGLLDAEDVRDFSIQNDTARTVIAVQRSIDGSSRRHELYESEDNGQTFQRFGSELPADSVQTVVTLDAAPSNPARLYVSGLTTDGNGVFLSSEDRGETWQAWPIDVDPSSFEAPYIAAIDPNDPAKVYVRTDHWRFDEAEGTEVASDRLLYSADGGHSFQDIRAAGGKLFGFALSPDGQTLLIGYGDPQLGGGLVVDPETVGLYKSATSSFSFEKIFDGPINCLTWTERGIYACSSEDVSGFEVGFSEHADFTLADAAPFSPLLRFGDVRGPLDCPACSSGARCGPDWQLQCYLFSACDVQPNLPDSTDCSAGGAAGAGDAGAASPGSGGANSATGGTGAPDASAGGVSQEQVGGAGCSCRSAGSAPLGLLAASTLGFFAVSLRRRRHC
jgi:hypothetical protein